MPEIDVQPEEADVYLVTVTDAGSMTTHRVTAGSDEVAGLGGGASASDVIAESFRFLLEREPQESIMDSFDLGVIARYFPEFPQEIRLRMEGTVG